MNIKDISDKAFKEKILEGKDTLALIFERQKELLDKYKDIEPGLKDLELPLDLNTHKAWVVVRDFVMRIIEELTEATGTLKNKSWKQDQVQTDVDHFKEELADSLHFFVELCILVGIDYRELFCLYLRKSEVNLFRQKSNY